MIFRNKNNLLTRKVKREGLIFVLTVDLFPVQVSLSQKTLSLRASSWRFFSPLVLNPRSPAYLVSLSIPLSRRSPSLSVLWYFATPWHSPRYPALPFFPNRPSYLVPSCVPLVYSTPFFSRMLFNFHPIILSGYSNSPCLLHN